MVDRTKEYRQALEALDSMGTLSAHHAKFNKLRHATEDMEFARLLDAILRNLEKARALRLEPGQLPAKFSRAATDAQALRAYCETQLQSHKPQWQLLAERAGWKPPQ